jgi:hypothetical protein
VNYLANTQLNFKLGTYDSTLFKTSGVKGSLEHSAGTVYMAQVPGSSTLKDRAYMFYDDGTHFLNIVPRMLSLENGGTNANLIDALPNSVFIQGSSGGFTWVEATGGAFYSPIINNVS